MSKQENQFRIGGFYRQQNGVVAEVTSDSGYDSAIVTTVWAPEGLSLRGGGGRRWSDGKYTGWRNERDDQYTLIPGELTQTPSGWVALGAEKQEDEVAAKYEDKGSLAYALDTSCVTCGKRWGAHIGLNCPSGTGRFLPINRPPIPECRKGAPQPAMHPADARMIARDLTGAENKVFRELVRKGGKVVREGEVTPTAKPNPFPAFRSPDCDSGPSDHLNASRHQMAGMKG